MDVKTLSIKLDPNTHRKVINGTYRVIRKIGEGQFGKVLLGEVVKDDSWVDDRSADTTQGGKLRGLDQDIEGGGKLRGSIDTAQDIGGGDSRSIRSDTGSKNEYDKKDDTRNDIGNDIRNDINDNSIEGNFIAIKTINRVDRSRLLTKSYLSQTTKIKREIQIMKSCNHPNVVKLHHVIDDMKYDKILLIMEYCKFGELDFKSYSHYYEKYKSTPSDSMTLNKILRDCVNGLDYLHRVKNIIHRDLKPSNLLISADKTIKISDFGVSLILENNINDEKELGKIMGTPAFYAPELCQFVNRNSIRLSKGTESLLNVTNPQVSQKSDTKIDKGIDIWALGVTIYCLIFNDLPFNGNNEYDLFRKIVKDELRFPQIEFTKRVTEADRNEMVLVKDLLRGMLMKDAHKRFSLERVRQHGFTTFDMTDIERRDFIANKPTISTKAIPTKAIPTPLAKAPAKTAPKIAPPLLASPVLSKIKTFFRKKKPPMLVLASNPPRVVADPAVVVPVEPQSTIVSPINISQLEPLDDLLDSYLDDSLSFGSIEGDYDTTNILGALNDSIFGTLPMVSPVKVNHRLSISSDESPKKVTLRLDTTSNMDPPKPKMDPSIPNMDKNARYDSQPKRDANIPIVDFPNMFIPKGYADSPKGFHSRDASYTSSPIAFENPKRDDLFTSSPFAFSPSSRAPSPGPPSLAGITSHSYGTFPNDSARDFSLQPPRKESPYGYSSAAASSLSINTHVSPSTPTNSHMVTIGDRSPGSIRSMFSPTQRFFSRIKKQKSANLKPTINSLSSPAKKKLDPAATRRKYTDLMEPPPIFGLNVAYPKESPSPNASTGSLQASLIDSKSASNSPTNKISPTSSSRKNSVGSAFGLSRITSSSSSLNLHAYLTDDNFLLASTRSQAEDSDEFDFGLTDADETFIIDESEQYRRI